MKAASSRKILITFGRSFLTLELARRLHAAGHIIYIADSMKYQVSRFSNAIYKNFEVPSPRFDSQGYVAALAKIVKTESIDLLIPIYEEITFLSKDKDQFPESCQIFCPSFDLYHELQNKWLFQCKLEEMGILHPKTLLVRSREDLDSLDFTTPFALKPSYSRASQKMIKAYPNQKIPSLSIEAHNPWVAQEWIDGPRFCTYTVCQAGSIQAHCVYPVSYAIESNSCLLFEAVEHSGIFKWVEHFVRQTQFTGQIAFDFIESRATNVLHAIECNPRATSGVLLFHDEDRLDRAFFAGNQQLISPKVGTRKQIATGMLLYGWRERALPNNRFAPFLKTLLTTNDVIFTSRDLKPFLFQPLIFSGIWMNSKKYNVSIPESFTYDHDWNGEMELMSAR